MARHRRPAGTTAGRSPAGTAARRSSRSAPGPGCAEERGEGEERARYRLGGRVAGEEGIAVDPALGYHFRLQQRQHHMATTEYQRASPVERIEQAQPLFRPEARGQRQADQQHGEQGEEQQRAAVADGDRQPLVAFHCFRFQQGAAGQAGTGDHRDLGPGSGPGQHARAGQRHQRQARAIRAQAATHAPDRLGHHRHRGDLQAMQHALGQQRAQRPRPRAKSTSSNAEGRVKPSQAARAPG